MSGLRAVSWIRFNSQPSSSSESNVVTTTYVSVNRSPSRSPRTASVLIAATRAPVAAIVKSTPLTSPGLPRVARRRSSARTAACHADLLKGLPPLPDSSASERREAARRAPVRTPASRHQALESALGGRALAGNGSRIRDAPVVRSSRVATPPHSRGGRLALSARARAAKASSCPPQSHHPLITTNDLARGGR